MGIAQVKELSENRAELQEALDIVAADGKYGKSRFLRPLQDQNCGIVVRLRQDRVLYRAPEQPRKRQRGSPRVHGGDLPSKSQQPGILLMKSLPSSMPNWDR